MSATTKKSARLEARMTAQQKELIERAARYSGRSVSEFVVQSAHEAAQSVIEDHEILRLNREESLALVKRLLNPPAPNRALKKAARQHDQRVESR